jgi:ribonuclease H2 subunit C
MTTAAPKALILAPARPKSPPRAATAHLLPCRIHHDGPIALPERLWAPSGLSPPSSSSFAAAAAAAATDAPEEGASDQGAAGTKKADDAPAVVHFRGRRLVGAEVRVPDGYRGVAMRVVESGAGGSAPEHMQVDGDDDEDAIETGETEQVAEFERMVVWRHDVAADRTDDRYARGIEEWIGFATAVSGHHRGWKMLIEQIHSQ